MNVRCPTCGGCGSVLQALPPGVYGFGEWPRESCRTCLGSGWIWDLTSANTTLPGCEDEPCARCNGTGREPKKITVTYVYINK